MFFISVVLILTELFCLEYLNLYDQLSYDLVIGSFDLSYREDSNDMCFISVALMLTELLRFEFYNKKSYTF